MILSTTYVTGQIPFKEVYLHGMVRAEDGKKMSKSRPESIIDPLEVIPQFGTDALRMALIMGVSPGNDQNWGQGKIEANRNFCNKLWNMARFAEGAVGDELVFGGNPQPESVADHWVIDKLNTQGKAIADHIAAYRFSEAYDTLYHLIWDEVADWYVEASKSALNAPVLSYVLETCLKLAHPFAPFVTETLWQNLNTGPEKILATALWPVETSVSASQATAFEEVKEIVSETRHIKTLLKIQGGELLYSENQFFEDHGDLVAKLARLKSVSKSDTLSGLALTGTRHACSLNVDTETAKKFVAELRSQEVNIQNSIGLLRSRLGNKAYLDKAPQHLVEASQAQLADLKKEAEAVQAQLNLFSQM